MLPQSDKKFKFKGEDKVEKENILRDAKLLEQSGAFSMDLEWIETSLAKLVTDSIGIPTIGIGASKNCDGQILVFDDLIGLNPIKVRFVKKYTNIKRELSKAVSKYANDVKKRKFPSKKYSY